MTPPTRIEIVLVDRDSPRWSATTITATEQSVDFSTADQDGEEFEPSFELTWEEIFAHCKEAMR